MQDRRWPTYPPRGIVIDSVVKEGAPAGRGSFRVRDVEGKVYLDAIGGIGCLPLGHAHPRWIAAMHDQMGKLVAASATFWTEPQQALGRALVERAPIHDARVFFGNTGTEGTEAAIKIATRATGRDVIVAFERAFHGRTLGSIALTGTAAYRDPYVTCLGEDAERFGYMNVARVPFGDLEALGETMNRFADRVAMVCLEPIQGEGGINPGSREFLLGVRSLCRKHGALLGLDEVQAGSGRTGSFSAWTALVGDDAELDVDIVWWAKALGGGYPIAACVARGDLAEHMTRGSHGSTFGGNPLACAAGLATLQIMEDEGLLETAGAQLSLLQKIAAEHPAPGVREVRGSGAMIGIELGDAEVAASAVEGMQARGVLVTTSGKTAIRCLLPFHAGHDELSELWSALRDVLEQGPAM